MLKKIKEKLLGLGRVALLLAQSFIVGLTAVLVLLNLLIPVSNHLEKVAEQEHKFQLIILGTYGPMLVPVDNVMVKNVRHEADGSLCFLEAQSDKPGCVKANQYFLKPINVK